MEKLEGQAGVGSGGLTGPSKGLMLSEDSRGQMEPSGCRWQRIREGKLEAGKPVVSYGA